MDLVKIEICRLIRLTLDKIVIGWEKVTISLCTTKSLIIILDDVIYYSDNLKYLDDLFCMVTIYYIINNIQGLAIPTNKNSQLYMIQIMFGINIPVYNLHGPKYIIFSISSNAPPTLTMYYNDQNNINIILTHSDIIKSAVQSKLSTDTINSIFPTVKNI